MNAYKGLYKTFNSLQSQSLTTLAINQITKIQGFIQNNQILKKFLPDKKYLQIKEVLLEDINNTNYHVIFNKAQLINNNHTFQPLFSKYQIIRNNDYYLTLKSQFWHLLIGITTEPAKAQIHSKSIDLKYHPQSLLLNMSNNYVYHDGVLSTNTQCNIKQFLMGKRQIKLKLCLNSTHLLITYGNNLLARISAQTNQKYYLLTLMKIKGNQIQVCRFIDDPQPQNKNQIVLKHNLVRQVRQHDIAAIFNPPKQELKLSNSNVSQYTTPQSLREKIEEEKNQKCKALKQRLENERALRKDSQAQRIQELKKRRMVEMGQIQAMYKSNPSAGSSQNHMGTCTFLLPEDAKISQSNTQVNDVTEDSKASPKFLSPTFSVKSKQPVFQVKGLDLHNMEITKDKQKKLKINTEIYGLDSSNMESATSYEIPNKGKKEVEKIELKKRKKTQLSNLALPKQNKASPPRDQLEKGMSSASGEIVIVETQSIPETHSIVQPTNLNSGSDKRIRDRKLSSFNASQVCVDYPLKASDNGSILASKEKKDIFADFNHFKPDKTHSSQQKSFAQKSNSFLSSKRLNKFSQKDVNNKKDKNELEYEIADSDDIFPEAQKKGNVRPILKKIDTFLKQKQSDVKESIDSDILDDQSLVCLDFGQGSSSTSQRVGYAKKGVQQTQNQQVYQGRQQPGNLLKKRHLMNGQKNKQQMKIKLQKFFEH